MRVLAVSAVLALSFGGATPAQAGDLLYRHGPDGADLLEQSAGRAYWVMLSECAGFYGAMSNLANDPAQSQQYLDRGMFFARQAVQQVRSDRTVSSTEANALISPYVSRARDLGEQSLGQNPLETSQTGLTPTMVMTASCDAVDRAYSTARAV